MFLLTPQLSAHIAMQMFFAFWFPFATAPAPPQKAEEQPLLAENVAFQFAAG